MVSINCDMGEAFGLYRLGDDAALMPLVTLANVACGFHASDFNHMRATVELAARHGVKVGAHPSLPDLQGFGRRAMAIGREELANCLIYQIGALQGFLQAAGLPLNHIKPHGALFGMAARQAPVAEAICDAADIFRVPILGLPGTLHETVYAARGHRLVSEFYADLDYDDTGMVIITREHPPVNPTRAAARCREAVGQGRSTALSGAPITVGRDSICIHSDTPNAVAVAEAVRAALADQLG